MLVPVMGIVQVGSQAMADRYTYLPAIGLAIAVVWTACEGFRRAGPTMRPYRPVCAAAATALLLAILMSSTWRQTSYWRNSEALWIRTLDCTGDENVLAHINLGLALKQQERLDDAIAQYRRALEIRPDNAEGHNKLGVALALQGKLEEALAEFTLAVKFDPDNAGFRANLEQALREKAKGSRPLPADAGSR
jgi:tetratricopeptide (TPR) repeat protein